MRVVARLDLFIQGVQSKEDSRDSGGDAVGCPAKRLRSPVCLPFPT